MGLVSDEVPSRPLLSSLASRPSEVVLCDLLMYDLLLLVYRELRHKNYNNVRNAIVAVALAAASTTTTTYHHHHVLALSKLTHSLMQWSDK